MDELDEIRAYLEIAQFLKSRVNDQDTMRFSHLEGIIGKVKLMLNEASKKASNDSRGIDEIRKSIEAVCAPPQEVLQPSTVSEDPNLIRHVHTTSLASSTDEFLADIRNRKRTNPVPQSEDVEASMLRMADDMKEAAMNVHSFIKKDNATLSETAMMQDNNMLNTSLENKSARDVRSQKRLSFMWTIIMVLVSLAVFLLLVPLILVT